jgi:hypothetical protein
MTPISLPRLRAPARGFGARAATTPGRLRLLALALVGAAILAGLVMASAVGARRDAAQAVSAQTEPLMVDADVLYASLSDADATAAATFLTGGLEPQVRRRRYLDDLRSASVQLTQLARQAGGLGEAGKSVSVVATQLPVYSGLVETARANNRQGLPVGSAYLRQASDLMRQQILPAASQLYALEARRLGSKYGSGTATGDVLALAAAAVVMLALLTLAQVFIARRTHRVFNVALVVSTLVLLGLSAWSLAALGGEQSRLSTAQREGSDSVEVLSAARILALREQADESLALVAHGGSPNYLDDFASVSKVLAPTGGLLGQAEALAKGQGSSSAITRLDTTFAQYQGVHNQVAALEKTGKSDKAVTLAVGSTASEVAVSDRLNSDVAAQIASAQARFTHSAREATSAVSGLALAIPLLVAVAGLLALLGLQQRVGEYR